MSDLEGGTRLRILEAALDVGLGRKYGHTENDQTNCVTFAEGVLQAAFPEINWAPLHSDLMIGDAGRPFSNVEALVSSGFREVIFPTPGTFSYCQGWRSIEPLRGHCFFFWRPPVPFDTPSMILEATNATSDWYRPCRWSYIQSKYPCGLRLAELIHK